MTPESPFSALEDAVRRQALEEQAAKHIATARCQLIVKKDAARVFFATLALRLIPEISWDMDTIATDGKRLAYNPEFISKLSLEHMIGVVAHEVLHNALAHHSRQGHRELKKWNIACDCSINPILLSAGFALPKEMILPGKGDYAHLPVGKSAEEYYALLKEPAGKDKDDGESEEEGEGKGCPDPGGCGGVQRPGQGSQAECKQSQAEWEVAVAQAHQVAKQRGTLPAGIERLVESVLAPKVDWREVLREFICRFAKNDYSWSPPNKRYVHMGLYLPGLRSEELGDVVVAVDTSGSINGPVLDRFAGELQGILESFDVSLTILYHDAKITNVQQWQSSDGPLLLEPKGGGGTSHCPVFEWVESHQEAPSCLVCLTDLYTEFPAQGPAYPVLWAVVGNDSPKAPFGQIVSVE